MIAYKFKIQKSLLTLMITLFISVNYTYSRDKERPNMSEKQLFETISLAEQLQDNYNFYKAMELAQDAKVVAMYYNNSHALTKIYEIIGTSYESNGEFNKAFKNYNKAILHAKLSKKYKLVTPLYYSLARLTTIQKRPLTETKFFYQKIIDNATIESDSMEVVKAENRISRLLLLNNRKKEAYNHLKNADFFSENFNNTSEYLMLQYLMTYYFILNGDVKLSNNFLENIKDINISEEYYDLYYLRSLIYYERGNYEKAYKDLVTYDDYQKSKLSKEKLKEVTIAIANFEIEDYRKNLEKIKNEVKEKDNEILQWQTSIGLALLILLISITFLVYISRNNIVKEKLNSELKDKNVELKNAKDYAEKLTQLKSKFVSTVTHELRTPLYGVIGLTELLKENPDSDKRFEYLESLNFSGNYLLALINNVLQLSEIETNNVAIENVPFNLSMLLSNITKSLHKKQITNHNNLHVELDPRIDKVISGDSVRISQILMNLVGNALKFTKNGNVWIKVNMLDYSVNEYEIEYIVEDDGPGIPKDKQKDIFDKFSKVKNNNSEFEGTGLGLSIVKKLVNLYGSEITLESDEGKGSKFRFVLPTNRIKQNEDNTDKEEKYQEIGSTSELKILVVDDNKINQVVTKNILKKKEYQVEIAKNGLEAVNMVRDNNFDLVLMDINMPVMGGLEATQNIREFNTKIPIIALTALEEKEMIIEAKKYGMNDLIVKPYDTSLFFQTIIKNINESNK